MKLSELDRLEKFCKTDMYGYPISFNDNFATYYINSYERKRIDAFNKKYIDKFRKTHEFDTYEYANKFALLMNRTLGNRLPDNEMCDRIIDIAIKKEIYKTVANIRRMSMIK